MDPPPPRAKRGKARSTTSTASSKTRRKTKASRGKSVKASAPASRRSPSPSRTVSRKGEAAAVLDTSMDVDSSPAGSSEPHPVAGSPPRGNESHSTTYTSASLHPLLNGPASPFGPSAPNKPNISPDTALNHPDPIVSLSPAGQSSIAIPQLLTNHERTISLEQWIRQEISLSYERLLADGRGQIELFKAKAAELRKCIDEL